jgi:hypothetical protein
MRKTVFLLSVSLLLSTANSLAAEPSKPKENLNQRASDAVKDIGDNMNKAGAAIKKSVDGVEEKAKQAGKNNATKSGKPNVGDQLQTNAKNALKTVEAGADKAEHAIVTTVKSIGKQGATNSADKSSKNKGPSLDQSMKEFGKNAEKAGAAMEKGVKKLGNEARQNVDGADKAIKKKTEHK